MNGFMTILAARGSEIRAMSDLDLAGAIHAARAVVTEAHQQWMSARSAGQEFRPYMAAHSAAQNELGALEIVWSEREMGRKLALFGTVWNGRA